MRTIVITVVVTIGVWCCVVGVGLGIVKIVGIEKGLTQHARLINQLIGNLGALEVKVEGMTDKKRR